LCHTFKEQVGPTELRNLILAAMRTNLNDPNITKQLDGANYSNVMRILEKKNTPSDIVSKVVDLYLEEFEIDSKNALNLLRLLVQLGDPNKIQNFMKNYVTGSNIPGIP
jgi:hypothetical protein